MSKKEIRLQSGYKKNVYITPWGQGNNNVVNIDEGVVYTLTKKVKIHKQIEQEQCRSCME